jgi:ADP-ribose pyrophosphatase
MKPCSLGFVLSKDRKKLLLIKRSDLPIWVLPGGGIEEGEEPREAGIREVFEETGLKVDLQRLASVYEPKNSLSSKTYIFEGFSDGEPKSSDEAKEAVFFPIGELPKDLFLLHEIWIGRILKEPDKTIEGLITEITFGRVFNFFIRRPGVLVRYVWNRMFGTC